MQIQPSSQTGHRKRFQSLKLNIYFPISVGMSCLKMEPVVIKVTHSSKFTLRYYKLITLRANRLFGAYASGEPDLASLVKRTCFNFICHFHSFYFVLLLEHEPVRLYFITSDTEMKTSL